MNEMIFYEVQYDEDEKDDGSRGDRRVSSRRFESREAAESYAAGVHPGRFPSVHRAGKYRTSDLLGSQQ